MTTMSSTRKRSMIDETLAEHVHDIKKLKRDDDHRHLSSGLDADSSSDEDTSTSVTSSATLTSSDRGSDSDGDERLNNDISSDSSTEGVRESSAVFPRTPSSSSSSPSSSSTSFQSSTDTTTSSDENDGDEEEEEESIITLPRPRVNRPDIFRPKLDNALLTQLSTFLPKIAVANQELEEDRVAGRLEERRLENVRDGEGYIEMNLGLGVLEGKTHSESSSDDDDDDGTTNSNETGDEAEEENGKEVDSEGTNVREKDVLGRLMGRRAGKTESTGSKPRIEVVEDG